MYEAGKNWSGNNLAATLFRIIANSLPGIQLKLKQAGMREKPEDFVKKIFFSAFYMTTGLFLILFVLLLKLNLLKGILILIFPFVFVGMFFYMLKMPDIIILKKEREINKEIVFAGKFLIIELESGVPLYNSIVNVSKSYDTIGKHFKEIVDKIDVGTPMEEAITETIEITPSHHFRKLLWQILNSLKTGADISKSLSSVVDQISEEQIIEVREYGRKLNPIAMFYMILAVVMPSIGVIMLIILATFISFKVDLVILLLIAGLLGFMQFMFYSIIKSQRPAVEL